MITAPEMAVAALHLPTSGFPCPEDSVCAATGVPISKGTLVNNLPAFSNGFMDGRQLVLTHGKKGYVLPSVTPFFSKNILQGTQKAIITPEGVYSLGKGENRAWFILNPPATPFAVVFSPTTTQHQIWRVPLTMDPDHWKIQCGPRTLVMRRQVVLRAWEACKRLAEAHVTLRKKALKVIFRSLPFVMDLDAGVPQPSVRIFAEQAGMGSDYAALLNLSPGEIWGLNALYYKGGIAVLPDPMTLEIKPRKEKTKKPAKSKTPVQS